MGTKSFKESEQSSECELPSDFKNTVLKIKVANKQKELVTSKKIAETMDEVASKNTVFWVEHITIESSIVFGDVV